MVLRCATSLRGALEGVGPESRDFFGPWNGNERSLDFQGPPLPMPLIMMLHASKPLSMYLQYGGSGMGSAANHPSPLPATSTQHTKYVHTAARIRPPPPPTHNNTQQRATTLVYIKDILSQEHVCSASILLDLTTHPLILKRLPRNAFRGICPGQTNWSKISLP